MRQGRNKEKKEMPFKYADANDPGLSDGVGTLEEYFTPLATDGSWLSEDLDEKTKKLIVKMQKANEERDSELERLMLELFSDKSGLRHDEIVHVFWFDYGAAENRKARQRSKRKGLNLICVHPDDAIMALYKDGQPIAAFYASFRGCYQAGGYIHEGEREYFAHDAFKESFAGPMNVWHDRSNGCSEIARDFLLNERTY